MRDPAPHSATVIEITCAYRAADQVENQAPRRDARDLVDVLLRLNFHDIHAHHAAFLHKAMNQLACLQEGHATRRRACYGWHHRWIEPVRIDGQIVVAAVRDTGEHGAYTDVMKLIRGDQL